MAAFSSKWKNKKLSVIICIPQTTQNLVISRSCFPMVKKMDKDLKRK